MTSTRERCTLVSSNVLLNLQLLQMARCTLNRSLNSAGLLFVATVFTLQRVYICPNQPIRPSFSCAGLHAPEGGPPSVV